MVFGRKKEASDKAEPWERVNPPRPPVPGQFRQPTDVTWDPQGNTFISDGYINARVAKFSKDGDWVKSWGEPGNGPGQFQTVHAIAIDRTEVTIAQFARFAQATSTVTRAEAEGGGFEFDGGWQRRPGWTWRTPDGVAPAAQIRDDEGAFAFH